MLGLVKFEHVLLGVLAAIVILLSMNMWVMSGELRSIQNELVNVTALLKIIVAQNPASSSSFSGYP